VIPDPNPAVTAKPGLADTPNLSAPERLSQDSSRSPSPTWLRGAPEVASVRDEALRTASARLAEPRPPDDRRTRVAIVIPARNEEVAIGRLIEGLPHDSTELRFRAFVCDDGSTDETGAVAVARGATVLRHARNLGIGAALTTGFEAARAWGADLFVQIDADGQHDPALIPDLLEPLRLGRADYVIGSRFLSPPTGLAPVRRAGVRFYTRLIRLLTGLPITDVTSGFRAFRAEAYDRLSILSQRNWAVEVTLRAGLNYLTTEEVSAPYLPRVGGRSQFAFRRLFVVYHYRALQQFFRAYAAARPSGPSRADLAASSRMPGKVGSGIKP